MAAKKSEGSGSMGVIAMFIALIVLAVWALISPSFLMKSIEAERAFAIGLGGQASDRWIYTKTLESSMDYLKSSASSIKDTQALPSAIRGWAQERIIATWLWLSLITYRGFMLLLYFFILFPLVVALSMDGWGVREISTHRFSSQSPMKHRMGVVIFNMTLIGVAVWIVLPFPIPAVVAPLAIIAVGFSSWMWLSNMQKRI
ncbi:MAG: DUF4400 domain-containing protein [Gallionella sp.]